MNSKNTIDCALYLYELDKIYLWIHKKYILSTIKLEKTYFIKLDLQIIKFIAKAPTVFNKLNQVNVKLTYACSNKDPSEFLSPWHQLMLLEIMTIYNFSKAITADVWGTFQLVIVLKN